MLLKLLEKQLKDRRKFDYFCIRENLSEIYLSDIITLFEEIKLETENKENLGRLIGKLIFFLLVYVIEKNNTLSYTYNEFMSYLVPELSK